MGKLQFKVKAIPGNTVSITTKETSTLNLNQWMGFKVKLEGDIVAYLGLARDSRYRIRFDNLVAN